MATGGVRFPVQDEAKASKQRYPNCLHRIEHDHCMALQKNVRKGIRPKRPQVMLTPDPKFSTMPELERDGSHLGATPRCVGTPLLILHQAQHRHGAHRLIG